MAAEFTVNFNPNAVMARIEGAEDAALAKLSAEVRDDSNLYCPWKEKNLIQSSLDNSDLNNGIVQWVTPYAQYLYYGKLMVAPNGSAWAKHGESKTVTGTPLNYSPDMNANACAMWFEKAKDIHSEKWIKTYEEALKRGI